MVVASTRLMNRSSGQVGGFKASVGKISATSSPCRSRRCPVPSPFAQGRPQDLSQECACGQLRQKSASQVYSALFVAWSQYSRVSNSQISTVVGGGGLASSDKHGKSQEWSQTWACARVYRRL